MDKLLIAIIALFLIAGSVYFVFQNRTEVPQINQPLTTQINSFEECVAAGNKIMKSNPPQCQTPDGKIFVENATSTNKLSGLIVVDSPKPNAVVLSPLTVTGQARGNWFFEASFPIVIVDTNNNELGRGIAQAQSDWMTENFVPFRAILEFGAPQTPTGNLILKKDNPSGLPQNDNQLIVPVKFQ